LLRACGIWCERTRRRATENTEKFPPPHVRPHAQKTAW